MLTRIGFILIWLALGIYAFVFAPPTQSDTLDLIINLSTGNWREINPLIVALFNIMGILPLIYACLLLFDGRGQKIPALPFAAAAFGVGIFALLPYFALRQPNTVWSGDKNLLLKILDSRWTGLILTISTIILLIYGFTQGDWSNFVSQWQTSRFIQVMSIDFCLLCLFFPVLIEDDLKIRKIDRQWLFWTISFVPLFGTLAYLCLRPPLPES